MYVENFTFSRSNIQLSFILLFLIIAIITGFYYIIILLDQESLAIMQNTNLHNDIALKKEQLILYKEQQLHENAIHEQCLKKIKEENADKQLAIWASCAVFFVTAVVCVCFLGNGK